MELWVKWDDELEQITMGPQSVPTDENWLPFHIHSKVVNPATQRTRHARLNINGQAVVVQVVEGDPALTYAQERQQLYPAAVEQLDYIYHNGVDAWKADIIDPIKAAHPKPE